MLLAGMLDLGLPPEKLHRPLGDLGLSGVKIRVDRLERQGIFAARVSIVRKAVHPLFPQRASEVLDFIQRSRLNPVLKAAMVRLIYTLARAEGKVHRSPWRKVQFHQVGRVDTWVNFTGVSLGMIHFGISKLFVSTVPMGARYEGHDGRMQPLPGPATSWLLRRFQTVVCREPFEWTTPTAAAILSAFGSKEPPPPFRVVGLGHAVGHRRPPQGPVVLRLLLGIPV